MLPRFVLCNLSRGSTAKDPFSSPVPSNFQFQQLDILADSLPWEAGSFDVVHVRFVLLHVRLCTNLLELGPAEMMTRCYE